MPPNSVLFSSRVPIGHIALAAVSCCTNQGCKSFVPNVGIVLPLWGYFAMKARTPDMIARASGTTFKEISGKGVGETLVPIPPIEEQRRIVAKLNQLFEQIDRAEKAYNELSGPLSDRRRGLRSGRDCFAAPSAPER